MEPPGQTTINELELAILSRMAGDAPELQHLILKLHVLSREFTGVGSFTKFQSSDSIAELANRRISLNSVIDMPGVKHGMGAILFCEDGKPHTLETYTYGDEEWDGTYRGFSMPQTS